MNIKNFNYLPQRWSWIYIFLYFLCVFIFQLWPWICRPLPWT